MRCDGLDWNKMEWKGWIFITTHNRRLGHKTYIEKQSVLPIKTTDKV